jgi:hypothetical protein
VVLGIVIFFTNRFLMSELLALADQRTGARATAVSMTVNLVPLWRTDGYFVLEERTGIRNLMRRPEASIVTLIRPKQPVDTRHRWLPLFGIVHIHALAALYVSAGIAAGRIADHPALGAATGILLATHSLNGAYRGAVGVDTLAAAQ